MKTLVVSAAAGLLLVAAVGCSSSSSPSRTATSTTTSTTAKATAAASLKPGDRYVALGSSIASGFGISVQSTPCGRSSRSYARLVAERYQLELTDVSCGAAFIRNVVDTPQDATNNPAQLTAVTPETKLITVSVGGNDIIYTGTALVCGDPTTVCTAPPDLAASVAATRDALEHMFERIKAAAPSATVVLVTYPREVGDNNCPALSFTDAEADLIRSMGRQLENVFVTVAEQADVVLVDPYAASGDHTACAPTSQRWMAGLVPDDGFGYHPTAIGHEVMADMVTDELGN